MHGSGERCKWHPHKEPLPYSWRGGKRRLTEPIHYHGYHGNPLIVVYCGDLTIRLLWSWGVVDADDSSAIAHIGAPPIRNTWGKDSIDNHLIKFLEPMLLVDSLLPKNTFAHRSFILFTIWCSLSCYSFSLLYSFTLLAITHVFSYLKSKIAFKHSFVISD
jgi:hypothetical protein